MPQDKKKKPKSIMGMLFQTAGSRAQEDSGKDMSNSTKKKMKKIRKSMRSYGVMGG